jgi:hypothetical protein
MPRPPGQSAAAGSLTASEADRGPCQRKVGHMADAPGYDGGHLIAATLRGVDERYDLAPQWVSVNRGLYEKMEADNKRCLKAPGGHITHCRIRVTCRDATILIPTSTTPTSPWTPPTTPADHSTHHPQLGPRAAPKTLGCAANSTSAWPRLAAPKPHDEPTRHGDGRSSQS